MVNSKAQQKIIELGKTIVKELKLDPGVDTLSKWMAHYVAEKIKLAERLTGDKRNTAEKECIEIILKLWEQRWSIPSTKSFLSDFEPLLKTLEKLNPEKESPFFYLPQIEFELGKENEKKNINETESYFQTALRVDKLARSLIYELLNQAVSEIELSEAREELIRGFIDLVDHPDTTIIRITSTYNKSLEHKDDGNDDETKELINEIKKRIKDLEEFDSLRNALLESYKNKIVELKS